MATEKYKVKIRMATSVRKETTRIIVYCPYCEDRDVVVEHILQRDKIGYTCECCNEIFLVARETLRYFNLSST